MNNLKQDSDQGSQLARCGNFLDQDARLTVTDELDGLCHGKNEPAAWRTAIH
jgi:hypothetical protein